MLLYRVFLHSSAAEPGVSGSATYLHTPQGAGRWDNPHLYSAWYLSTSAEGAIGETFGNLHQWSEAMLQHPSGLRRALATFSLPDDLSLFDLDDPTALLDIGMRPSQVVARNPAYTQKKAAAVFAERGHVGQRWAGLRWWSFHRPTWTNVALWTTPSSPTQLRLEAVDELSLEAPAMLEASRALARSVA
jgi:RES domain-containing protein